MTRFAGLPLAIALTFLTLAAPSRAQSIPDEDGTVSSVEVYAGRAWFLDDQVIDATVFGGQARFRMSPLMSVGPEVTWMVGPGDSQELYVTGNVWFDLRHPPRPSRGVTPFLVVGGGLVRHTQGLEWSGRSESYSSMELAVTGGGGVRIFITPRWYVAPEVRIGWEPHVRFSVNAGYAFGPTAAGTGRPGPRRSS